MKSLFTILFVLGGIFLFGTGGTALVHGDGVKVGGVIIVASLVSFGVAAALSKKSGGKKSAGPLPW